MNSFSQASAKLTSRVLHSASEFHLISTEWTELFRRCPEATPFQHPQWLISWMNAFAPRELVGIEIRVGTHLIGFAPLLIYPRDQERVLAFAGGGISDYLGLLAESGREPEVIDEVLRAAQTIAGWSVLDLTDVAVGSNILKYPPFGNLIREHDVCYALTLPETQDQVLHACSTHQRANLRNARSRTRREGGARIELATSDNLPEFLDDLFRLHALRWSGLGEPGVLSDERVQQFHRAVAPHLLSAGILRLYRMRVEGRTIAVLYSLFHRETVFCYLQGFDPEFARLSPGTQLTFAVMQDAVTLGMRRFDFLRGEEGYKLHWRPQGECTYRVEVPRSHLTARLLRPAA